MDKAEQEKNQLREKGARAFGGREICRAERKIRGNVVKEVCVCVCLLGWGWKRFCKVEGFCQLHKKWKAFSFSVIGWLQPCRPYPSWRMLGIPSSDKNKVIPQQPQNLFSENKFIRFSENQTYHWFNQNLTFSVY